VLLVLPLTSYRGVAPDIGAPSLCRVMPTSRSRRPRRNSGWLNSSQGNSLVAGVAAAPRCMPPSAKLKREDGGRLILRKPGMEKKTQSRGCSSLPEERTVLAGGREDSGAVSKLPPYRAATPTHEDLQILTKTYEDERRNETARTAHRNC